MNGNFSECPWQLLLSDFLSSVLSTSSLPTWLLPPHPSYLGTLILSQRHFNGFLFQTKWVPEGQIASLTQSAHWRHVGAGCSCSGEARGPSAAVLTSHTRWRWRSLEWDATLSKPAEHNNISPTVVRGADMLKVIKETLWSSSNKIKNKASDHLEKPATV